MADELDPFTQLRAEMLADRFALQGLWAAFIKSQGGNVSWVHELAAEASELLEDAGEGQPDEIVAAALNHHDVLWQGIRNHLEGQLSEEPEG